jgi:hypothetical protein
MSQAMLRGLLAGACLAAARAQYGGCDLSTLPQQIQAVMTACCSDPSTCADGGLPTVCSGVCSDVFEDFWGDCSSTIEMLGSSATGGMDLSRFDSVCKKGASSGVRLSRALPVVHRACYCFPVFPSCVVTPPFMGSNQW